MAEKAENRYSRLVEHIFRKHYRKGATQIEFDRTELTCARSAQGAAFLFMRLFPEIHATRPAGSRIIRR